MVEIIEPTNIVKLRLVLTAAQLIESAQTNLLITSDDRAAYIKTLNDKTHKIIDAALTELGEE